jgi:predicted dehydrogenase
MTAPSLRWGFLGASRIGAGALKPAVHAAGHRLLAVAARDRARAEAFGAERAYQGYAALLDDPEIDAVYIALPNDLHLPWTVRSLAAGKHVLCEKPLALSAAEVMAMQAAERASGRWVMEAFCHRFHPQFDRACALLRQGAIGTPLAAQGYFVGRIDDPADFRWNPAQGGGALFDLGCYCVSLLRGLFGRAPRGVAALRTLRHGVDARFTAQLDFGDDVTAQLYCAFDGARQQGLTLLGSTGALRFDWPFSTKNRQTTLRWGDQTERFAAMDPYAEMVRHVAAVVAGAAAPRFGLADSLEQARTMDALFAAAETRQPARL